MYDSQVIADRIKTKAKSRGCTVKEMLADLGLGGSALLQLSKGHGMSYLNLAKIADYLNCPVDYLLGRTEDSTPERRIIVKESFHSSPDPAQNTMTNQFMKLFEELDFEDQVQLMGLAVKMKKAHHT